MRLRFSVITLLVTSTVLFAPARPIAHASTTITVTTTVDEYGAGAQCSLREAIRAANTDTAFGGCPAGSGTDTIRLGAGTYTLTRAGTIEDANAQGDLDISSNLALIGAGATTTIIDGNNLDRVIDVLGIGLPEILAVQISNVTVRNGAAPGGEVPNGKSGGGIANQARLRLENSIVENNRTITGGGGGIWNLTGSLTLVNSTVRSNQSATSGGGIVNGFGTLTLTNSVISANTANISGGGVLSIHDNLLQINNSVIKDNQTMEAGGGVNSFGPLVMAGSTISSNTALQGGGIWIEEGTATIRGSTIFDNRADDDGGGLFNDDGNVTLVETTISDNQATFGGGVYNNTGLDIVDTVLTITRSTVDHNLAFYGGGLFNLASATINSSTFSTNSVEEGAGGAILNNTGALNIASTTIANNTATFGANGTAIANDMGTVTLRNTLLSNAGPNCVGDTAMITSNGHNLETGNSCNLKPANNDLIVRSALLGPLANNGGPTQTHALLSGSPAIDAGTNVGCPATDQRSVPRPLGPGGVCDIGAFEYGGRVYLPLITR